jgi:hypothetical protein
MLFTLASLFYVMIIETGLTKEEVEGAKRDGFEHPRSDQSDDELPFC